MHFDPRLFAIPHSAVLEFLQVKISLQLAVEPGQQLEAKRPPLHGRSFAVTAKSSHEKTAFSSPL